MIEKLFRGIGPAFFLAALAAAAPPVEKKPAEIKDPWDLKAAAWVNGGPVAADALKGRIVVLHFFEPACDASSTPAIALSRIHQTGKGNGVVVVGIAPSPLGMPMSRISESRARGSASRCWAGSRSATGAPRSAAARR